MPRTVRTSYNLDEGAIKLVRSEKTLLVSADADELKTAFVNLLDNSVKYSGHERKISVRIRPSSLNHKVAIVVRDNGVGIPAADLKRVFKRFHRVANSGRK